MVVVRTWSNRQHLKQLPLCCGLNLQVGAEIADPIDDSLSDEKRKEIFAYFLRDFMSLIWTPSSSLRSVSQAIRSYGYFAAVGIYISKGYLVYISCNYTNIHVYL